MLPSIQAQPYYEMDSSYDSYKPELIYSNNNSYESQYGMGSYEKPSYGNDNYEPREYQPPQYQEREYNNYPSEYEMNNSYEKKSYRYDYYEQPREYPSYKEEYKPDYQSYGYDKDYKSKDKEKNSISISNINCNTVNFNFVNNDIGNVSIGNSGIVGTASDDGTNGALSGNANGNNGGYGYQKGKDITCIANINNNNTNIITNDNTTDDNGNGPLICEECFTFNLNEQQINALENAITRTGGGVLFTIEDFCEGFLMSPNVENSFKLQVLELRLDESGIPDDVQQIIIECLEDLEIIEPLIAQP